MVSSSIVDKYIGESARLIREMFNYARDHQPCIIFMDEIDAIGEPRSPPSVRFSAPPQQQTPVRRSGTSD